MAAGSEQAMYSLDSGRNAWTGTGRWLHSQSSTPKAYTSAALVRMPSISSSGGMCVTVPAQAAGAGELFPCSLHTCNASLLQYMHIAWVLEGGTDVGLAALVEVGPDAKGSVSCLPGVTDLALTKCVGLNGCLRALKQSGQPKISHLGHKASLVLVAGSQKYIAGRQVLCRGIQAQRLAASEPEDQAL